MSFEERKSRIIDFLSLGDHRFCIPESGSLGDVLEQHLAGSRARFVRGPGSFGTLYGMLPEF